MEGREPILQPNSATNSSILSTLPVGKISLLPKLILNPKRASKHIRIHPKWVSWSELALQNNKVSSAYNRWERINSSPSSLSPTLHLVRKLPSTALFIKQLRTSIPKTKRYEERGSPWRSPLELRKKPIEVPLIRMEKQSFDIHHLTQANHLCPKPILLISSSTNSQLKCSYAFSTSNLQISPPLFLLNIESMTSLAIKVASRICLPSTKAF